MSSWHVNYTFSGKSPFASLISALGLALRLWVMRLLLNINFSGVIVIWLINPR